MWRDEVGSEKQWEWWRKSFDLVPPRDWPYPWRYPFQLRILDISFDLSSLLHLLADSLCMHAVVLSALDVTVTLLPKKQDRERKTNFGHSESFLRILLYHSWCRNDETNEQDAGRGNFWFMPQKKTRQSVSVFEFQVLFLLLFFSLRSCLLCDSFHGCIFVSSCWFVHFEDFLFVSHSGKQRRPFVGVVSSNFVWARSRVLFFLGDYDGDLQRFFFLLLVYFLVFCVVLPLALHW